MPHRRVSCATLVLSVLFARQMWADEAHSDSAITQSFEAQIARLDADDPRAPQALETHLRYAEYLAKVSGENCKTRLGAAQSHLQAAQDRTALSVVLPQGLARAADVAYQIHAALAYCGDRSDTSQRDSELRTALQFAQRSAGLYEDSFDYPAMLTMRFNAAITYQSMGDAAAAQIALKSVINADREHHAAESVRARHRRFGRTCQRRSYLDASGAQASFRLDRHL